MLLRIASATAQADQQDTASNNRISLSFASGRRAHTQKEGCIRAEKVGATKQAWPAQNCFLTFFPQARFHSRRSSKPRVSKYPACLVCLSSEISRENLRTPQRVSLAAYRRLDTAIAGWRSRRSRTTYIRAPKLTHDRPLELQETGTTFRSRLRVQRQRRPRACSRLRYGPGAQPRINGRLFRHTNARRCDEESSTFWPHPAPEKGTF